MALHPLLQRLLLLIAGVGINSLLHTLVFSLLTPLSVTQIFLTTLTGGILLTPFVYLIYEYLHEQHFRLILDYGTPDPQLRTSLLMWCFLFCLAGLSAQLFFTPEIERLLVLLVFIPQCLYGLPLRLAGRRTLCPCSAV
ncbi:MASE1 [Morganella morganii]|nr:MASE1 [Morganella morganii]